MNNWISVDDRLPEFDVEKLLVVIKVHDIDLIAMIGAYCIDLEAFEVGSGFRYWGNHKLGSITH